MLYSLSSLFQESKITSSRIADVMTTIAGSLQPNLSRNIPEITPPDLKNIPASFRGASSKQAQSAASKSNDTLQNFNPDGNTVANKSTEIIRTRFRTMSSSPTIPSLETSSSSDLFHSASSHLIGYLPQCEAVSRNAQVGFLL